MRASSGGAKPTAATSGNITVDIYLKEHNGSREIRVPWLPDVIEYKSGGVIFAEYDIMNKGPIGVPTGSGLKEVSWGSVFPGQLQPITSMMRGDWKDPASYLSILEDWKAKGTPLNILVTGYPINFGCALKDFNAKPAGGFGDIEYDITLIEDRNIIITTKTETKSTAAAPKAAEQKRPAAKTTSYTIKKGDCMWSIAQKFLGSGAKWPTIYQANKEIIDSTAKKYGRSSSDNGRWIYPGVTIQIPQ